MRKAKEHNKRKHGFLRISKEHNKKSQFLEKNLTRNQKEHNKRSQKNMTRKSQHSRVASGLELLEVYLPGLVLPGRRHSGKGKTLFSRALLRGGLVDVVLFVIFMFALTFDG